MVCLCVCACERVRAETRDAYANTCELPDDASRYDTVMKLPTVEIVVSNHVVYNIARRIIQAFVPPRKATHERTKQDN